MKKFLALLLAVLMALSTACFAEAKVDTVILKEADAKMLNTYSVIAVNPEAPFADADGNPVADVAVNTAGADALIHFLLSDTGLAIADA